MKSEYNANQIIEMLLTICKAAYPTFEDWVEYKETVKFLSQKDSKQFSRDEILQILEKHQYKHTDDLDVTCCVIKRAVYRNIVDSEDIINELKNLSIKNLK